jgi:uncharacterized protein (DUF952 family)
VEAQFILHIATKTEWQRAQRLGSYEPPSLETEGFIHCSTPAQAVQTANSFFRGQADLVLLRIDTSRLTAELKLEPAAHALSRRQPDLFPHLYGPLNLDAVTAVIAFAPDREGKFHLPPQLATPTRA